jgi:WD40 repeat protein
MSDHKYDVFISYSHEADSLLAPVLQRLIRRVGQPWYMHGKLRIFRDSTNLSTTPDAWESIEAALADSASFVLMASPYAAQSPWVSREVQYWREQRSPSTFSIVLTKGTITWDEQAGDFDWATTTALSRDGLSGWFDKVPLWLNTCPPEGVPIRRSQRNDRLRDTARAIAAPLYGLEKDQLDGEDERESRRARLTLRAGIAALLGLTVISLFATYFAYNQYLAADEGQRLATARLLSTLAETARAADPRRALQLGEAADRIHPDAETRSGLIQTLSTTRYVATLTGHTFFVDSVAFSPDGHTLATGGADKKLMLWDVSDPTKTHLIGTPLTGDAFVDAVAFAPTGRVLAASGSDNTVTLWDVSNPAQPRRLGPPLTGHTDSPDKAEMVNLPGVDTVAFAPDGRTLATGAGDHTVMLWDVSDPARPRRLGAPLTGHTGGVISVRFAPDGHTLATASADSTVLLWNVADPTRPRRLGPPLTGQSGWATVAEFSPDGRTLATGGDNVMLWDVTDPARPRRLGPPLTDHDGGVRSVAFTPDGRTLATGSPDHSAMVWDISDPARPVRIGTPLTGHTNQVTTVAFAPNGRTLATGSWDHTVMLWDIGDQPRRLGPPLTGNPDPPQEIGNMPGVSAVAFTPRGHTMATGSVDRTAMLWDVTDPARPRRLGAPLTGHTGGVTSVAFTPDGRTMVTGSWDRTAMLWDVTDPARPRRLGAPLTGHTGQVTALAFTPDGRTLAIGSFDNTVTFWDVGDPAKPRSLGPSLTAEDNGIRTVAFAPDGRTLATGGGDYTAKLWDVSDPARPRRLGSPLAGHTDPVTSVAFAPDGRTLATGSSDDTALLWDVTDLAQPRRLGPALTSSAFINAVAFAPDGHTLATGSSDNTAGLWDLTGLMWIRDHAFERACAITHGSLGADDWERYGSGLPYEDACTSR